MCGIDIIKLLFCKYLLVLKKNHICPLSKISFVSIIDWLSTEQSYVLNNDTDYDNYKDYTILFVTYISMAEKKFAYLQTNKMQRLNLALGVPIIKNVPCWHGSRT